ncbi:ATP-grasp domain-containing protein [Xenophilus sp. Marseille-Q4582]|uniref:ATP-grasp domain-containing protein n=1 Tax=Xenophilus sp. Marseille-Q4582 TaxID=2866600 RepID=UPI001CE4B014|nr:ATP-grasp domain-containing protein [Xenophilus sp. Marseille-Q4582]
MKCLVTAIGSMSAEAVISRLARLPGVEVVGCNLHPASWTPASRLVRCFYQVPSAKDAAAYVARLLLICERERVSHLIALTDPEVDVLSAHREAFAVAGIVLCIPPEPAVQVARDKLSIYRRFADHPRIRPIATADLHEAERRAFSWPLIAKPRRGRSSEGQVHIPDAGALQFWGARLVGQDYVVQPCHVGDVMVVDVVRHPEGKAAAAMTRQELLRTANGAGMTVRMQPGHPCDALAQEVADTLDMRGCVNVEFLIVNGVPLLMDINPRFSAGVAFSIMAGYDMVANHLRCFVGENLAPCLAPPDAVYTRGFLEYSLQN